MNAPATGRRLQATGRSAEPLAGEVYAFLRLALRSRWHKASLDEAFALAAAPGWDWQAMLRGAAREGVAPLLYTILPGRQGLPPEVAASLKQAYHANAARNTGLLIGLGDLLKRLAAAGIPALTLKGAALAETLYGDIGQRVLSDIDLLIRQEDLARAVPVLAGGGFLPSAVEMRPGLRRDLGKELTFSRPGTPAITLDLHWYLIWSHHYRQATFIDWLWATARPAEIGRAPGLVLGAEAQFLHSAVHLLLHGRGRWLRWWQDLAEMAGAPEADAGWEDLLAAAERWDLGGCLRTVLVVLAEDWLAPIPADILARLPGVAISVRERGLLAGAMSGGIQGARGLWRDLALLTGWSERVRYACALLFPSPAYMRRRYGAHGVLLPLYYPYRWLRGL